MAANQPLPNSSYGQDILVDHHCVLLRILCPRLALGIVSSYQYEEMMVVSR